MKKKTPLYYLIQGDIQDQNFCIATLNESKWCYALLEVFTKDSHRRTKIVSKDNEIICSIFRKPLFKSENYEEVVERAMLEIL